MANTCGFCGTPDITKEHVWPDWLRKVTLDSRGSSGQRIFHAEIERGGRTNKWRNLSLEIKVGMPCAECNGGWMSKLEVECIPFMTPMIDRGQNVTLSQEQQLTLARWAIKTAMVYEFTAAADEEKYFTEAERLAFKERFEIPANTWVWTGRYDGVRPIHAWLRRAPKGDVPKVLSLTLSANFIVLQVFSYRDSQGDLSVYPKNTKTERLFEVWPDASTWTAWPPGTTIDDEGLGILDERFVEAMKKDATSKAAVAQSQDQPGFRPRVHGGDNS